MKKLILSFGILPIIFIHISIAIAIADDSLVLYLTFDKDDGNTVKDLSAYMNNGRLTGNPNRVAGIFESALEFSGAADSVEIPHNDSLNMESAVTLEMWVKLASGGGNDNQAGIEKGGWESGEYSIYAYYVPGEGTAMQFMDLPVECADANSGHLGQNLKDDQWHHIAGTWDGKTISLYTDGNLEEAWDCKGGPLGVNKQSVFIGSRKASERFLRGVVDEVRIYNKVLSEAEIKKDMETLGKISVSPSGKLAALWGMVKRTY